MELNGYKIGTSVCLVKELRLFKSIFLSTPTIWQTLRDSLIILSYPIDCVSFATSLYWSDPFGMK